MSAETHTPGPWAYRPNGYDDWGFVRSPDGWVIAIASVNFREHSDDDLHAHRRAGTDPVEANARLIAAAPDLLEVLRLILPLAKGYAPEGRTATARRTCNSWIEAAEKAITKATGESQ